MRTSIIAAIIFFSLAPMALAGDCGVGQSSDAAGNCVTTGTGGTVSGVNSGGGSTVGGANTGVPLYNPLKAGTSIESFLNSILDFVIRIGSIIVILMTVFVGYKFVVAQGKPDKIEEAKKMLLWTIIGALVLIGAKVISTGILATVKALGG